MANMSYKIFEQKSRHLIIGLQKANALSKIAVNGFRFLNNWRTKNIID